MATENEGQKPTVTDAVAASVPYAIIVEWKAGATLEEQEAANKEIASLMSQIVAEHESDPANVLPAAIERLTIKRV